MPDRLAHDERSDEERANVDVDRHAYLSDASVLLDDGEALVVPIDDETESYEVHRWLMARRRGEHRFERGGR